LEVNFEEGIILPRGTPARSGVMHSISSMPRHFSHSLASFQFSTPRLRSMKAGLRRGLAARTEPGWNSFLDVIEHRICLGRVHHSRRGGGRKGQPICR